MTVLVVCISAKKIFADVLFDLLRVHRPQVHSGSKKISVARISLATISVDVLVPRRFWSSPTSDSNHCRLGVFRLSFPISNLFLFPLDYVYPSHHITFSILPLSLYPNLLCHGAPKLAIARLSTCFIIYGNMPPVWICCIL